MEFNERDDFVHNLLYTYFRWAWLVAVVFGLLFFSVFFMAWLITPTWDSKAYLQLDPTVAPPSSRFADPTRLKMERMEASYAHQAIQMLTGKEIAFTVVGKFDLAERMRRKTEEPENARERIHAGFGSAIATMVNMVRFVLRIESGDKVPDWEDKAARDFRAGLFAWVAAKPVNDTDIVELVVKADSPELANNIADFMVEELRKQLMLKSVDAGQEAVKAFEKQLADLWEFQRQAELALQDFLEAHGGIEPAVDAGLKTIERDALQSQRDRLLAERTELERQRDRLLADERPILAERMLRSDVVRQLRSSLFDLLMRKAALEGELTEAHPDVTEVDLQIRMAQEALVGEVLTVLDTVGAELRHVEEQLDMLDTELKAIARRQFHFSRLQSDVDEWQALRRELQAHVDVMRIATDSGLSPMVVRVLDRARVSHAKSADSPSWLIVAVIAFLFASGGSVFVPPCIEYWRDPIRGKVDLLRKGIVPLVVVPSARCGRVAGWWRRMRGRPVSESERAADRFHDMAATLAVESREKGGRLCVVVTEAHAPTAGEEVCRRLAEQASRMGCRVVVLSVHSPERPGIPSIANADQPLDCRWEGASGCFFVSLPEFFGALPKCGSRPAEWVTDFDLMLVDSPEAETQFQAYLTQRSDAAILIADSRRQSLSEIIRLSKSITASGCRLLGAMLIGHTSPLPSWLDRWHDRPV